MLTHTIVPFEEQEREEHEHEHEQEEQGQEEQNEFASSFPMPLSDSTGDGIVDSSSFSGQNQNPTNSNVVQIPVKVLFTQIIREILREEEFQNSKNSSNSSSSSSSSGSSNNNSSSSSSSSSSNSNTEKSDLEREDKKKKKSPMNAYFDIIYCLNLHKRSERMATASKRFQFANIEYERFNAIDGSVCTFLWKSLESPWFTNASYVGCCLSHLSMYQQAIDSGHEMILIVEDDNRIHRRAQELFQEHSAKLEDDVDLLHLAYIPLTDDLSMWNYSILKDNILAPNIYKSKNLWSLMAYGISAKLMRHLLSVYKETFPMELDRYFVTFVMNNPEFKCRAIFPQIFCAEDNVSDNTGIFTPQLMARSVDLRHAQFHDYI
jgi:GR25 family glycosyltransferase involved in LPS biosynthesis